MSAKLEEEPSWLMKIRKKKATHSQDCMHALSLMLMRKRLQHEDVCTRISNRLGVGFFYSGILQIAYP